MKTMKTKTNQCMKYITVTVLLLTGYVSHAQKPFSLNECIKTALENNEQMKNSQLDVLAAEYRIKEVKSALMPTVDINGQYQYYTSVPSQYAPASAFGGPEGEYTKMVLSMPQTMGMNIQSSQTLFNQSVLVGVKAAGAAREVSRQQVAVTKENIIYNVTATYYSIQVLNDNLERLQENIANVEKTVQINESLKANELIADNVHNRLLINLENLKNQYENQKLTQEKNVTLLKYLMNISMDDSLQVESFDYAETMPHQHIAEIAYRPDLQLQMAQVKLSEYDKKSIAAKFYPTLSATTSLGYTSYYDELSPTKQINSDWINSSYFMISLKIPVFDGFQKQNQLRQKEVAIRKNNNMLAMMKANAQKEMEDALTNYRANKNLVQSNKKSLDLAEQLFNSVQSEYANGISSLTDFINAQNDLSNARTNYSTALLNLKLAELDLRRANGSLIN
jgi:outer membrane protein TolC